MKKLTTTTIWAGTFMLLFCCFTTHAQDCFFTTSYEILEIANNGDGTCDYTIDLCAEVDENALVHSIDYNVMFDSDGDGDDESIVNYNFTPGIQIPDGSYCLSSSAPAQTFTITTPCGNSITLVITGINSDTNEECMNMMEDVILETVEDEDVAEMANHDELVLPDAPNNNLKNNVPTTIAQPFKTYALYPSIAQNVINLQLPTAYEQVVHLFLTDLNGQVLSNFSLEAGTTEMKIAVEGLNPGYYYLVPAGGFGIGAKGFVKM